MKKKFDAVKTVRNIRDHLHQKTKKMSAKELIKYYQESARRVQAQKH